MTATARTVPQGRLREAFYTLLAGIFLTSLTLGNIVGTPRFVDLGLFQIPAGLLAYPIRFSPPTS